jgi:uncharacterized coiled-coil DUF342 family protein
MSQERKRLDELIRTLQRQRDELAVQIHLGRAEAKEEWDKITAKLDALMKDYEPLKGAVEETADNVFSAMRLVGREVLEGFERIRKSL